MNQAEKPTDTADVAGRLDGLVGRLERLRQYIDKASFSSASDKFSAMECLAEIKLAVVKDAECRCCHGTGWMVRDKDIGTDQECFACEGRGVVSE